MEDTLACKLFPLHRCVTKFATQAHCCRAQGFVLDIPEYNEAEAREVLRFLRATNWLDAQTRALFMEFSLYLPPSNILLSARLVMEVHETGTIWTDISLEPINLGIFRSDSPAEVGLLVVSLVLVFGAMVWDLQSTWKLRRYHVKQTSSVCSSYTLAPHDACVHCCANPYARVVNAVYNGAIFGTFLCVSAIFIVSFATSTENFASLSPHQARVQKVHTWPWRNLPCAELF